MDLLPRSYDGEGIIAREYKLVNASEPGVEAGLRPRVPQRRPAVVVVRRLLLRASRAPRETGGAHLRTDERQLMPRRRQGLRPGDRQPIPIDLLRGPQAKCARSPGQARQ